VRPLNIELFWTQIAFERKQKRYRPGTRSYSQCVHNHVIFGSEKCPTMLSH